jgi:hypothetical protein
MVSLVTPVYCTPPKTVQLKMFQGLESTTRERHVRKRHVSGLHHGALAGLTTETYFRWTQLTLSPASPSMLASKNNSSLSKFWLFKASRTFIFRKLLQLFLTFFR